MKSKFEIEGEIIGCEKRIMTNGQIQYKLSVGVNVQKRVHNSYETISKTEVYVMSYYTKDNADNILVKGNIVNIAGDLNTYVHQKDNSVRIGINPKQVVLITANEVKRELRKLSAEVESLNLSKEVAFELQAEMHRLLTQAKNQSDKIKKESANTDTETEMNTAQSEDLLNTFKVDNKIKLERVVNNTPKKFEEDYFEDESELIPLRK